MRKKINVILMSIILFAFPITCVALAAEQTTDTGSGTVNGNPDKYVEIIMENNTLNYSTLKVNDQKSVDYRTDADGKYVIFDSLQYLSSNKSIIFNEGASNSNIFAKVTYTDDTYPAVNGLSNLTWLFFKDTAATNYVQNEISGTLTTGGGGVTMPTDVTEIGSFSKTFVYYTSSASVWSRNSKTIYVALGNNGRLYVGDTADLSTASYYTVKGEVVSTPFYGNYFTEASTFPTAINDTVTLDFGYMMNWDNVQSSTHETFSALIDLPMHAAFNHNWTWNLSIIVEFFSEVV